MRGSRIVRSAVVTALAAAGLGLGSGVAAAAEPPQYGPEWQSGTVHGPEWQTGTGSAPSGGRSLGGLLGGLFG
jgi:hypothetical protein